MTEEKAKARLCLWAESQVGYMEGASNWNDYAENPLLQQLYGWRPQNQPWCDVFVDTAFLVCFGLEAASAMTYQPIGQGSALCRTSAQYYKQNGAWSQTPEIGAQIFFYVNGDINHTGVVIRVVGGSVITVEGNSSDTVAERCYSIGDSSIAGYGIPLWSVVADEEDAAPVPEPEPEPEPAEAFALSPPTLCSGMGGPWVAAMQGVLASQRYNLGPDGVDGDFGVNTLSAVRSYQLRHGLSPDGVVGPKTWASLLKTE